MRGNGITYTAIYGQSYRLTGQTESGSVIPRNTLYSYSLRNNLTAADDLLDPAEDIGCTYDERQILHGATGPWGALAWT